MYTKETLKKIADVLKLDVSVFEANLKSEKEETLEVPALVTEEQKNEFGKNRFDEGKRAATEIAVKDIKEKHGLEFTGKSLDSALEAFAEKKLADAKVKPDDRIVKLEGEKKEIQEKLRIALEKEQSLSNEYSDKLFQVETMSQILSYIPNNTIIPREKIATLFKNERRVAKEDDRIIVYEGGKKLLDNVLNPIPLKDAVLQYSESYIDKSGMGGKDLGGGAVPKFKTGRQHIEYCQKNGIEPMSEKGLKLLNENKEAGFDPNN